MKRAFVILLFVILVFNFSSCDVTNTVEVIKCYYCGGKNAEDAKYCSSCGKAFEMKEELTETGEQSDENTSSIIQEGTSSSESTAASTSDKSENTKTVPEETIIIPESNDSSVMRNSGVNGIYTGGKLCVDGEIIYLGYAGNLYVFCGSEVDSFAGGGSNSATLSQIYLHNGFVYYTNLNNHCIYRMNISDGKREIVLSGIGEIKNSFICGDRMYIESVNDKEYKALYLLNLTNSDNKVLYRESETVEELDYELLNESHVLIAEKSEKQTCYYLLDALTGVTREFASTPWEGWAHYKNSEQYLHFRLYAYGSETETYYKINKQDYSFEAVGKEIFDAADDIPTDDGNIWKYYLSVGANNLCRMHKESKVAELILNSGSGNRKEGELVAKTYAIKEILYADDGRIVFKRSRMADGVEWSVWIIDSDGNNLSELIRDPYYDPHEVFPIGTSSGIEGGGSSGVTGSDNGPAVGTKMCALCGGDGKITCYYCKGSGKGSTVYVMGVPTQQSCSYCGSSGWRLCSGCGGKGTR